MYLRRTILVVAVLPLLIGAPGCTTNPATGGQSFTAFMSPAKEREVGRQERPKILKQFGGEAKDAAVRAYVNRIGQRLAHVSDLPELAYTFTVLNTNIVNAMATPGGYVYVTRGLMALADSEAELAGVIGHEIGHVTAHHTAQRYSTAMTLGLGSTILGILLNNQIVDQILDAGSQLYLASYSREQEFEADVLGVRYLMRSGYDTAAMASFLEKIEAHSHLEAKIAGKSDGGDSFSFLSTHPRSSDRVARAIRETGASPMANPRIARVEYLGKIDGLIFGGDPENGIIRDWEFAHPALRFRFEVPPGFRLVNGETEVVGLHQNGAMVLFDRATKPIRTSILAYARDQWASGRARTNAEAITVGGMDAATAATRFDTRRGPRDVRLVAIRFERETVYRFFFVTPPRLTSTYGEPFRRTTYSFRRLSAAEARAVRPLRVRLRVAQPGDTLERFVNLMAVPDFKLDWFRVLNGLSAGEGLRDGQLVKVVAD